MAINAAAGFPQNSGILVPEIWSGKLLKKFYAATVLASIANTDYEGEIASQGDKVWIRTVPDLEIRDYQKGSTLNVQRPEAAKIALTIDRAKYWNFTVDSIDKFQSDVDFLDKWTTDASTQLKIRWDTDALGSIYTSAASTNQGLTAGKDSQNINLGTTAAPLQPDKTSIVEYLVDLGNVLDEQNVPEEDRFVVLPSWAISLLKKSDLKNAYLTGDNQSVLRNGRVGDVDRFTIYGSNLLSKVFNGTVNTWNVIAGQKSALTFASQLTDNEIIKAESTFGWLGRGLQVCGWQVIKPEALVYSVLRK